jgi:hypothetical protein
MTLFPTSLRNQSIDAVFKAIHPNKSVHTDFYMFRPSKVDKTQILNQSICLHTSFTAEDKLYCWFAPLILNGQALLNIPGTSRRGQIARIVGPKSPIVHNHWFAHKKCQKLAALLQVE